MGCINSKVVSAAMKHDMIRPSLRVSFTSLLLPFKARRFRSFILETQLTRPTPLSSLRHQNPLDQIKIPKGAIEACQKGDWQDECQRIMAIRKVRSASSLGPCPPLCAVRWPHDMCTRDSKPFFGTLQDDACSETFTCFRLKIGPFLPHFITAFP